MRLITAAGSVVTVQTNGAIDILFDWYEEGGCFDCTVNPDPQDELTWECEICGGGSALLTQSEERSK